ncbi:hypothetical protein [Avibacterium endocarditidis]|uniref:Terminase n=1 Tax=Avibacterium endocarditidis TaxID=380674 RepID=A0ABX4ZRU4_9PAST|nr:hypothetical protein [Avibacterium endocarditidis]POY42234.1 hypothetical protein C3Z13_06890 [Avibacterium endocarditidis]
MAKKSYDWVAIKVQFINSSLSAKEFAEKYGIPYGSLSKQVAQGKWIDERKLIGKDAENKSIEFSVNNRAAKLAQIDDDCVKTAELINNKIIELLPTIDSPVALKALSGALKDTQSVTRLALGASTENQATSEGFDRENWLKRLSEYEQNTNG